MTNDAQSAEIDARVRVTTVRMTEEQAIEVEIVARVLGISVSELIRTAIVEYLSKRKAEVEFRQRLALRSRTAASSIASVTSATAVATERRRASSSGPAHPSEESS